MLFLTNRTIRVQIVNLLEKNKIKTNSPTDSCGIKDATYRVAADIRSYTNLRKVFNKVLLSRKIKLTQICF